MSDVTKYPRGAELAEEQEKDIKDAEVQHVEGGDMATAGHYAHQADHEETVLQALRKHRVTVLWVIYAIWILVASSFDNNAASSILGIPQFRQDFGYFYGGDYVLPASWQSAYSGGPAAATVFGAFTAGWLADRIGRKMLIGGAYVVVLAGVTVEVVANTQSDPNAVFFAGKLINGYAIGGIISSTMTYVGEIAPTALRGIVTAACALAFTIGPFILSFILNAYGGLANSWAYKSSFVAQYGVTGIGLLIWPFMPESPTWFIVKGKDEAALRSLRKLGYHEDELEGRMSLIKLTLAQAAKETAGATYMECFKKSNLRRTMIAVAPLSIQAFTGVFWIAGYATYYFQLAGYTTDESFKLGIIQQVLSVSGNVMSWFMIERFGRRFLSFWGLVVLTVILLIAGGLACVESVPANKGVTAMILVYCWLYNVTIGATAYVAMSEIATSRLRAKTASLALLIQSIWATFWSFVLPFMFNPDKGNLGAKVAFIFGGLSVLCCIYFYFYHPETKGRSYEELDEMFQKKIPARQFSTYETEASRRAQQVKEDVVAGRAHL